MWKTMLQTKPIFNQTDQKATKKTRRKREKKNPQEKTTEKVSMNTSAAGKSTVPRCKLNCNTDIGDFVFNKATFLLE